MNGSVSRREDYAPRVIPRTEIPSRVWRALGSTASRWGTEARVIDLRILGRTLLHAALVGVSAGLASVLFSWGVELLQEIVLEHWAGYVPLRAAGEFGAAQESLVFRPWLVLLVPAFGATLAGYLANRFGPETLGGGGNACIRAYHRQDAIVRYRVPVLKAVVSILTLGTGGVGGREGPTMQIGAGTASVVARWLRVTSRERRILYIAGIAAGVSAVFRAPLGAALFAAEVVYRDNFESDALVPAVFASVVAYSTALPFGGASKLFAHASAYPFIPEHLPYFILLAIGEALLALIFIRGLETVRSLVQRLPGPPWIRPGVGGLGVGVLGVSVLMILGQALNRPGAGFGILGGSYGAAQLSIVGAQWMPTGWGGVELLLLLCGLKLIGASLTIGSGGSAGDFAPSLVLGGLFGGAFGRALLLLSGDARIDPGAFALVGMGAFFGGAGHVPLSSMVLVCELCGSYDLIVPLMLAEGVTFVALRNRGLYSAQLDPRQQDRRSSLSGAELRVRDVQVSPDSFLTLTPSTRCTELIGALTVASHQLVFPVLDSEHRLAGVIPVGIVRLLAGEDQLSDWVVAADLMQLPAQVSPDDDLERALKTMIRNDLLQLPVVDALGKLVGFVDERSIVHKLVTSQEETLPPTALNELMTTK